MHITLFFNVGGPFSTGVTVQSRLDVHPNDELLRKKPHKNKL